MNIDWMWVSDRLLGKIFGCSTGFTDENGAVVGVTGVEIVSEEDQTWSILWTFPGEGQGEGCDSDTVSAGSLSAVLDWLEGALGTVDRRAIMDALADRLFGDASARLISSHPCCDLVLRSGCFQWN